jgi:hypothetical protein
MKKVLLAENSADGLVASLYLQELFHTCDPVFGEDPARFETLGMPVYSVGIPTRKAELYIDNKGEYEEKEGKIIKPDWSLTEIVRETFPSERCEKYDILNPEEVPFECFFELYGASSCFGQLRFDPGSWKDENLAKYMELQQKIADKLLASSDGEAEVFLLPPEAGSFCRTLLFLGTKAKLVLMLQGRRFWLNARHGYEKAFKLRNFMFERPDSGIFTGKVNPVKLREQLEKAMEKYDEKGEMFR